MVIIEQLPNKTPPTMKSTIALNRQLDPNDQSGRIESAAVIPLHDSTQLDPNGQSGPVESSWVESGAEDIPLRYADSIMVLF